jgi:pimeloyl-ACP methyl ester carboxylesterase
VALELALRFPSQVGRLVLMGAEASFHSAPATAVARRVLEQFPLRGNSWFVNQFFNLLHGNRLDPGPISEHIVSRCWETDQGVIASRLRALESFDVSDELWQLDVPTLVFAGSRDVIVSPDHQRSLAESISGARFEPVMGAGHVGFLTHRVELVRVLARWLRAKSGSFL